MCSVRFLLAREPYFPTRVTFNCQIVLMAIQIDRQMRCFVMNSIDRNQREDNYEDLQGQEAVSKIKEMVEQAENCFFCSAVATGESNGDRPMNVREVDDEGNLWFLSASDSRKNQELAIDPAVKLYFQGSRHSDFMQLNGQATISRDREKIRELWSPVIQTWFTEGM